MEMETMHSLKKKLCKQLDSYAEIQNLGGNALEDVANIVKTIKNLDMIMDHEGGQGMASQRGQFMGSYNGSYDDASYRRGRDSMGRFVSMDEGASMRGSYHNDTRQMTDQLQQMMQQTDDPSVKQALRQAVSQIGGMM